MAWVKGKTAPAMHKPQGVVTRFGRVPASAGDRSAAALLGADKVGDREAMRRKLVRYGKWHNPRKRTEPPSNMMEGWLVETDPPPRVYVEPPAVPDVPDQPPGGGQDQPVDPQQPNG